MAANILVVIEITSWSKLPLIQKTNSSSSITTPTKEHETASARLLDPRESEAYTQLHTYYNTVPRLNSYIAISTPASIRYTISTCICA